MRCESLPIDVNMKTKHILSWILCFAMLSTISCSGNDPAFPSVTENPSTDPGTNPGTDPGTDPGTVADPTITPDTALYFRLGLKWETAGEGDAFEKRETTDSSVCNVPVGATGGSKNITCTFSVPEARLYYSHVQFKVGTGAAASCPILMFRPYYYKRSNADVIAADPGATPPVVGSPGYTPPAKDATPLSCSTGKEIPCWGGAAPHLVPGFPDNKALYLMTAISPSSDFNLKSENSTRYYGTSVLTNYLVTNNLDPVDRVGDVAPGVGRVNERVDSTYVDYKVTCYDKWYEQLYSITVVIADENIEGGMANDHFMDWF